MEANKLELETVPFAIQPLIEDIVDICAPAAASKGLEIQAIIKPDVPLMVKGDVGRVQQILTNLIGNAVKFTSKVSLNIVN